MSGDTIFSMFLGWLAGFVLALGIAQMTELPGYSPMALGFSLTMFGILLGRAAGGRS